MKKLILLAALGVVALSGTASAQNPFCQGRPGGGVGFGLFHKQPVPAFQAAPWYLYWPYDAHFMTPAPLNGAFAAPPYGGHGLVNPFFPAAGGGNPAYGPAPAAPAAPVAMPAGGIVIPTAYRR
jgi:hypothetical protein